MTKKSFIKHAVISSLLAAIAFAATAVFCVAMFYKYSPPSKSNTVTVSGTVKEVYETAPKTAVFIEMTSGERLEVIYKGGLDGRLFDSIFLDDLLNSSVGYSLEELADLLEGKAITCKRLKALPWVVEIGVDGTVIDTTEMVNRQMTVSRVAMVIVTLMAFVLFAALYISYISTKYKRYKRAEKKRIRKLNRARYICKDNTNK